MNEKLGVFSDGLYHFQFYVEKNKRIHSLETCSNTKSSKSSNKLTKRETSFCKLTFVRALLEHLFQDFQPCWIIINNKNTKTDRKRITSRRSEAIFHEDRALVEIREEKMNSEFVTVSEERALKTSKLSPGF